MNELQESVSLSILWTVFRNRREDWLSMISENGKLYVQGTVEHHVSIFLIREYPLLLTTAYIRPLTNGFTCSESTLVIVTYDASKETVVTSRNPVMVVERDTGECRGVDLIFFFVRDERCKPWIESMYALDDKHMILSNA